MMENGDTGFVTIEGRRHRAVVVNAHDNGLVDLIITVPKKNPAGSVWRHALPEGGKTHATVPAADFTKRVSRDD